jgi:integrase
MMTKVLSSEEIEAILKRVRPLPSSYYWSAVIAIMAYAGLRDIEVIELLSEDVDLETGLITVNSTEDSAQQRQIQISKKLLSILEDHPSSSSKYLFPNIGANSKKWYESSFEMELKKRLPNGLEPINLSDSFGPFNG